MCRSTQDTPPTGGGRHGGHRVVYERASSSPLDVGWAPRYCITLTVTAAKSLLTRCFVVRHRIDCRSSVRRGEKRELTSGPDVLWRARAPGAPPGGAGLWGGAGGGGGGGGPRRHASPQGSQSSQSEERPRLKRPQ